MKSFINTFSRSALVLCVVFLISGCATTKERPIPSDPKIQAILLDMEKQNSALKTFNGQGSISITEQSKVKSYRLAWAAAIPDRIRLIVIFSGQPIETVAADGENLYLKSHTGSHVPITRRRKDPSLEPFIGLPLTTNQITCYLSGKVPIPDYKKIQLDKITDGTGSVLSFYKNEETVVQQVFLDGNNKVLSYEITENAKTRYRVSIENSGTEDNLIFPTTINVVQGERSCLITVEKTTPNPELSPETFVVK